jgi:5'-nucleotidase
MGETTRILVTNDDGIEAEGLHELARALERSGREVVVAAPNGERSGSGAALGYFHPDAAIEVKRVEIDGVAGPCWAVDGPPGLCVLAARLGAFGEAPEIVVAGINPGLNTGRAILHSGTVGAALTAQNFGARGLAVSVDPDRDGSWSFAAAADLAIEVLPMVESSPPRSVLNLNVPGGPRDAILGVRWARLAAFGAARAAIARAEGDGALQMELRATNEVLPPDCDTATCAAGYAALTALVGVVEAWPTPGPETDVEAFPVPGGPLHEVHALPDASDHATLRSRLRPEV